MDAHRAEHSRLSSKRFQDRAKDSKQDRKEKKEVSVYFPEFPNPKEKKKYRDPCDRLVELDGMKRNVQGSREGFGVSEGNSPGKIAGSPVTASGQKAADLRDSEPQRKRRGHDVDDFPKENVVSAAKIDHGGDGEEWKAEK